MKDHSIIINDFSPLFNMNLNDLLVQVRVTKINFLCFVLNRPSLQFWGVGQGMKQT
jgi:hypothetical protein